MTPKYLEGDVSLRKVGEGLFVFSLYCTFLNLEVRNVNQICCLLSHLSIILNVDGLLKLTFTFYYEPDFTTTEDEFELPG